MNLKLLIKQVEKMDHTTDEFAEFFHAVNCKYMTFENPDNFQVAASVLNMILHRAGNEYLVETLAKIAEGIFEITNKNIPAIHSSFELSDKHIFFDIYTDKKALEGIHKMLKNSVLMRADEGD